MKYLVAGDLHGDVEYTKALVSLFVDEKYDRLVLTGDLTEESVHILNRISDKITAVSGNCDSYSEIEIAKFLMPDINYIYFKEKLIVLSHGHRYSPYNYDRYYDIFVFGHSHCSMIYQDNNGKIIANPGSLARPRDGVHSYIEINDEGIEIHDFNSKAIISKVRF